MLFHKVFWFLVFNGFAFVFLSALERRKNTFFLRSKITRVCNVFRVDGALRSNITRSL